MTKPFDLLRCPITKGPLKADLANNRLISIEAKVAFPIINGIPVLIPKEAVPLQAL